MQNLRIALEQLCETHEHVSLKRYSTFGIGGEARFVCAPTDGATLLQLRTLAKEANLPFLVVGNGSNLLFGDKGFSGIVALTKKLDGITVSGNTITAGAGASLATVCNVALEHGLGGLEFAFGIPGSVGGAVYMNAGAYGGEMKDVVTTVHCIDGDNKLLALTNEESSFTYRHSRFSDDSYLITGAEFTLTPCDKAEIKARMDDFMSRRTEKQPLDKKSCGSTFKRPASGYASALIEQCGLKGVSVGDAMVSEKHSGFVINNANATCQDVLDLCAHVSRVVEEKTGITLSMEVKIIEG